MRFDDVLDEIGGYGLFQKRVFYLTCLIYVVIAFYLLNPVFLLGVPEHRCAIPGYDNDTFAVQSPHHHYLINQNIPTSDTDPDTYDRCHVLVHLSHSHGRENASRVKVTCDKWVYDKSVFKDTFVTKADLVCDKSVLAATAGMLLYFGMLVGSLASGVLADRYGRKVIMYVSIVLMFSSAFALAFSESYGQFATLQFVLGASSVGAFMPAYIISIEVTSPSKRMWPGIASNFPYSFGLLVYTGIAYGFKSMFPIQLTSALLGVFLLSYWWLIPESPRWLLTKGRIGKAESLIMRAARWNKATLPAGIFDDKTIEDIYEQDKSASCLSLLSTKTMLSRSLLIFFNWATCSFVYFGLALDTGNLHGNLYLNFALGGLVEIPANILVLVFIDRIGRKPLYISIMATAAVSCISTLLVIEYGNGLGALSITLAMIGRLAVTAGFALLYIYSAELFPTTLRNAGLGSASLCARAGSLLAPFIVNWGENIGGNFGRILPLSLFGGMSLLSAILSLLLPETLNKHLPETVDDSKRFLEKDDETQL